MNQGSTTLLIQQNISAELKKTQKAIYDVASSLSESPFVFIENNYQSLVDLIEIRGAKKTLSSGQKEEFDQISKQYTLIKSKQTLIQNKAKALVNDYHDAHEIYIDSLLDDLIDSDKRFNCFGSLISAQYNTWLSMKQHLDTYYTILSLDKYQHNNLACLLERDDKKFIEFIDRGQLPLTSEIGFIAIQRLKDIAHHQTNWQIKAAAKKQLSMLVKNYRQYAVKETLLYFNKAALEIEVQKLLLHRDLYPNHRVIWLGTARTVDAMIELHEGQATYFNPTIQDYSWGLNRAWLQTACLLGYEFKLIEQHYPNIEKAILSGRTSQFIAALAQEIRESHKTSQYNGSDSPTATTQEILALMDNNCMPMKKEDGSLAFSLPKVKEMKNEEKSSLMLRRSHSSPNLFKVAPLPPLPKPQDHFSTPKHWLTNKNGSAR